MADDEKGETTPPTKVIDYYAREREVADSHVAERLERELIARKASLRRARRTAELIAIAVIVLACAAYLCYRLLTER